MFKNFFKSLLFLLMFSSSIHALEVSVEYKDYKIALNFDTGNYKKQEGTSQKNWVGIYKVGTSNDWENVLQWAWVKDLGKYQYSNKIRYLKLNKLDAGDYDARFFLNNSYYTFSSLQFSITKKDDTFYLYQKSKNSIEIGLNDINLLAEDTWLAIFKKGDASEWENIIDWTWCRQGGPGSNYFSFDLLNYSSGEYEVRLFLNNSYIVKGTLGFNVNNGAEIPKLSMGSRYSNAIYFHATHEDDGKSWIGLFEKGATSSKENLKNWSWVTTNSTLINIENMKAGKYDVRLFYKESYDVEAEIEIELGNNAFIDTPFTVNNNNYSALKIRFMNGTPSNEKDWLAMFKKDAQRIRENIISWVYVGDKRDGRNVKYVYIKISNIPNGEYDLVFFENDSYKEYGRAGKIIIDR